MFQIENLFQSELIQQWSQHLYLAQLCLYVNSDPQ